MAATETRAEVAIAIIDAAMKADVRTPRTFMPSVLAPDRPQRAQVTRSHHGAVPPARNTSSRSRGRGAEWFVRTIREEYLDRMIFFGENALRRAWTRL